MANTNDKDDLLKQVEVLREKAEKQKKEQQANISIKRHEDKGSKVQLPLWPELARAMPNDLARSALFAPIARGRRKMHWKNPIASRDDVAITYAGPQLDEADRDVWLQILHEARKHPVGVEFELTRHRLLQALKRNTGKSDYLWLHGVVQRLFAASLFIETARYVIGPDARGVGLRLLGGFEFEGGRDSYKFVLDKRTLAIFHGNAFGLVQWSQRLALEQDMAKWLQCLIASNERGIQRYAVEDLQQWMGSTSTRRLFRARLREAMGELARVGIIKNGEIERSVRGKEQAIWTRL